FGAAMPYDHNVTSVISALASTCYTVAFNRDGDLLASAHDYGIVRLWEVSTGQELRHFEGHTDSVRSVAFSPDGHYVVSGSVDDTVRLWEVSTGQELRHFEGHTDWVQSVAFSPDGHYVVSSSVDDTVRLWEVSSGALLVILFATRDGWVAFTPQGH